MKQTPSCFIPCAQTDLIPYLFHYLVKSFYARYVLTDRLSFQCRGMEHCFVEWYHEQFQEYYFYPERFLLVINV